MEKGDYYMNIHLEDTDGVVKIIKIKNNKVTVRYSLWNEGERYSFIETKEWILEHFRPFPKLKGQLMEKSRPETKLEKGEG